MHLSEFIAEIKTSMKSYDSANLIDEISIQNWVIDELKRFGSNIMDLQSTVIPIKNNQGRLPDNYWHLRLAIKVSPYYYDCQDCDEDIIYAPQLYDKIERTARWNSAGECEYIEEKKIKERVYVNHKPVDLYYNNPQKLEVRKGVSHIKSGFECVNLSHRYISQCPHHINIQGRTLTTSKNFKEGNVYIQYYGLLSDEEGNIIIPETQHNRLKTYLEYYVKKRILEDLILNNDDPNVIRLLNYYKGESDNQFSLALTETKFESLRWRETKKLLTKQNKEKMYKYEKMFPA